jgi:hypothetical protein
MVNIGTAYCSFVGKPEGKRSQDRTELRLILTSFLGK